MIQSAQLKQTPILTTIEQTMSLNRPALASPELFDVAIGGTIDQPSARLDELIVTIPGMLNYQYPNYYDNTVCHMLISQEFVKTALHVINTYKEELDCSLQDFQNKTILIFAAKMRKANLVQAILTLISPDKIAKMINLTDQDGRTALHYAYALGLDASTIAMLIKHGADETILDNTQKRPLDLLQSEEKEIIEILDSVSIDYRRSVHSPLNSCFFPELDEPQTYREVVRTVDSKKLKKLNLLVPRFDANGVLIDDIKNVKNDWCPVVVCKQNIEHLKKTVLEIKLPPLCTDAVKQVREKRRMYYSMIFGLVEKDPTSVLEAIQKGQTKLLNPMKKEMTDSKSSEGGLFAGSVTIKPADTNNPNKLLKSSVTL